MEKLELTYAGDHYLDRTAALESGELSPAGINLTYVVSELNDLFRRMAQDAEYPSSEMSMSSLIMMIGSGDNRLVGIPVFPSRTFRINQIYINVDAGIEKPNDLVGRNVGIPEYQMTAGLWIRAFLQHEHGVTPDQIHWWTGGVRTPFYRERSRHPLPEGVRLDRIPEDRTLESMLESGELDALCGTRAPAAFESGSTSIRRLFPDYRSVDQDYFNRTGFFPIMHTVVVRQDIYEKDPWIAMSLLNAFHEAKRLAAERLADLNTLAVMHPWIGMELEGLRSFFGGDPFVYGLGPNLRVLEAMARFSHEQGLTSRRVDPPELFAPETWEWQPPVDALSSLGTGNQSSNSADDADART